MQLAHKTKQIILGAVAALIVLAVTTVCIVLAVKKNNADASEKLPTETGEVTETVESTEEQEEVRVLEGTVMLDPVDEVGAWIGSGPELQTTDAKFGGSWLAATTRDDQGSCVLSRAFEPPLDLTAYKNGYLHMWVYVEDLAKLSGGQIELSSSGMPDNCELSWDLMLYVNASGWNELWLPFDKGALVGGEIDLTNVDFMRVYGIMTDDNLFGIDAIELTCEEPPEKSHIDENGQYVLDEIEGLGAWVGTAPRLVGENAPVGSGYVYTDTRDGDAYVLSRTFEPMDVTAFSNGYLHMWIYVANIGAVSGGQIEISSAGVPDAQECGWDVLAYVTKSGWNEVYLPFALATRVGSTDFTAINYMRVYILSYGSNSLGIDYACLSLTAPPEPSRIDSMNQYVIDKIEAKETWTGTNPYMSYNNPAVGSAWLASSQRDAGGNFVFARTLKNLNAAGYKSGYLHIHIYIENADLITGGQIELSSSGEPDRNETSWNVGGLELKNGWNDLYLPISEANIVAGGANFGCLNYIRVYIGSRASQTIGLDYIALSLTAPQKPSPIDENGNYIIDEIHGIAPWDGSKLVFNTQNGFEDGADWLSTSCTGASDLVFFRNFSAADLSSYQNGYLHIWVYVNNVRHVTGGMVEVTSSGTVDEEEIYWNLLDYLYQDGWNELYLPFNDAQHQGDRNANMAKLNCIRVVVMFGPDGGNAGIDRIYATTEEPPKKESDGVIDHVTELGTWSGSKISYETKNGYEEAADWLKVTQSGTGDVVFFCNYPAVDATPFKDGSLHLWVYTDSRAALTGGMIEITSSGTVDEEELWWPLLDYLYQDGWNELWLPLSAAQTEGTKPADITKFNCIRVCMMVGSSGAVCGVDEVWFSKELHDVPDPTPIETNKIVIHAAEALDGLDGNSLTLQDNTPAAGSNWIKTAQSTASVIVAHLDPAVDATELKDGYLHVWLYVEDASKVLDGQVELTSSGVSDNREISWDLTAAELNTGWNSLYLKLSDANAVGDDAFDITKIDYFRVYINFSAALSIGIDEVALTREVSDDPIPEFGDDDDPVAPKTEIDPVLAAAEWSGTPIKYMTTDGSAEGAGWIRTELSSAGDLVFFRNLNDIDGSGYKKGYVHAWIYIDDIAKLTGGMLEMTSCGTVDEEEIFWNLKTYLKTSGWNEVWLPMSAAEHQGSKQTDLTKLNCIRVVLMLNAAGVGGLDDIYFSTEKGTEPVVVDPDLKIQINTADSLSGWYGTEISAVSEGSPSASAWVKSGADACPVLAADLIPSIGISQVSASGYLHIRVYIEGTASIAYGQIELSSSGRSDDQETSWDVMGLGLKEGWNDLYLPFASAAHVGTTDYDAVNYFRIYIGFNGTGIIGADDIYACASKQ